MLKVAAITNHELASTNYWDQLEQIAASDVDFIVLREKNLSEEEYTDYAKRALRLCSIHQKTCILQHFGKAAIRLHIPRFQCSLPYLETHSSLLYYMTTLGVSVHTVEEAVKAEQLGATYLMASHVFPTACKPSDPPIGVDTVEAICKAVKEKGLTIVATKLFINDNGLAKLVIALAKGKKIYDKRATIKEKDLRRELDRGE